MKRDEFKYYNLIIISILLAVFAFPLFTTSGNPAVSLKTCSKSSLQKQMIAPLGNDLRAKYFIKWKGIGETEPECSTNNGPFNGYIYSLDDLYKLPIRARYFCLKSDLLPGNLFFYSPSTLRSPPIC